MQFDAPHVAGNLCIVYQSISVLEQLNKLWYSVVVVFELRKAL
jgi:hypothetical protein